MTNEMTHDKPVVLCVDDDQVLLSMTRLALEFAGYEVLTATSGRKALEVFSSQDVDAVVLDYEMPGMNGAEVAREMKRRNPGIPKLMFSGCSTIPAEAKAAIEGFCSKPADLGTLIAKVKSLCKFRFGGVRLETARWANTIEHACSM
jgi:CheY-like chemotaxis protein